MTKIKHRYPRRKDSSYVTCTNEKLQRILKTHKTRSTFNTENTLQRLLHNLKGGLKIRRRKIFYEIECSNYEKVWYGKSKRSLKFS